MSKTVGLSRFVLIRARILYSVFSQAIGLQSAGVVGMSVLGMHNTMPCFCCYMIRTFKCIWLNKASMSFLMLYQLTLKNSRHMPFLPGAFLHVPLFVEAISFSSEMGGSRKPLHARGKVLCQAFSVRETQASFIRIGSYLLCRNSTKLCRMPLAVVFATPFLSIALVIIRETNRFLICTRWKWDWISPLKG